MELRAFLLEERTLCRQLITLAQQERAAILSGDVEQLRRISARQDTLAARMAAVERRRLAALAPIAEARGEPVERVTLDDVLRYLPPAEARAIGELQAALRRELQHLQRAKAVNKTLLERALASVTALLDLVRGVHGEPARYARTGAAEASAPVAVLDRRV